MIASLPLALLPVVMDQLWPLWMSVEILLLVAVGVDLVLLPRRRDLHVDPALPDRLPLGASIDAVISIAIAGRRRPVRCVLRMDASETLVPLPPSIAELGIAPSRLRFPLTANRRGDVRLEALWVRAMGPLGLVQGTHRIELDHTALAVPDLGLARRQIIGNFSAREYRSGLRLDRYPGQGSELESVREFVTGMDHRHIHWKASARHAKLLSRQFRAESAREVVLALDTGRLMGESIDGRPRLAPAIHAALLMMTMTVRSRDRLGFYSFGERPGVFVPPRAGLTAARSVTTVASELAYATSETNYAWSLATLQGHLKRRALVVVFTDFVDTATAELLVDGFGRLVRRHLVVFVALRDPLLAETAGAEPGRMRTLHRALVADSLLRERAVVFKRLARMGIQVVDAQPREVSVQLLNRYLAIKRREMI